MTLAKPLFRRSKPSLFLIAWLIVISVAISFILKRASATINQEIQAEVAPSVWWDIVISWSTSIEQTSIDAIETILRDQQAIVSQKVEMNYTLSTPTWPFLISLRWVDNAYPLYGEFDWKEKVWDWSWVKVSQALYESLFSSQSNKTNTLTIQSETLWIESVFTAAPWARFSVFDWV